MTARIVIRSHFLALLRVRDNPPNCSWSGDSHKVFNHVSRPASDLSTIREGIDFS